MEIHNYLETACAKSFFCFFPCYCKPHKAKISIANTTKTTAALSNSGMAELDEKESVGLLFPFFLV